jgi:WD40 repeat protein
LLNTRQINHCQFFEQESRLVTAGVDGVLVFQFDVKRTQPPSVAVKLDPHGKSLTIKLRQLYVLEDSPKWVQRVRIDTDSKVFISWTFDTVCFHNLANGKRIRFCKDIGCDRETNRITDVALSQKYRYFLVASSQGQLNLWKLQEEPGINGSAD